MPHVLLEGPWEGPRVRLAEPTRHHLENVLRLRPGADLTYTDGRGTTGSGSLAGESVLRGGETTTPAPFPEVTIAVAPPQRAKRARFIVEKLGELGVDRLVWLHSDHGHGRPPHPAKSAAWAVAALEQSRGDRLLRIEGPTPPSRLWRSDVDLYVADPAAGRGVPTGRTPRASAVVMIGPEGGFAAAEIPAQVVPISLGTRILRTETAAIVAAALFVVGRDAASPGSPGEAGPGEARAPQGEDARRR